MPDTYKKNNWKFSSILFLASISLLLTSCNLDSCNDGGMPDIESHYINRIYSVNLDGSGLKQVIYGGNFSLLPNSKIIYTNNYKLYTCNSDGSDSVLISPGNSQVYIYKLYMDETRIQINQAIYPGTYIHLINTDGSGLTQFSFPGNSNNVVFSPNGQMIAFTNNSGMYIMNIDGSARKQIKDSTNRSYCYDINFTPDGKNVIYIYDIQQGTALDLRAYNIQSTRDTSLFYSNDGNHVRTYSMSKWNTLLFTNGDGVNLMNLTDYKYKLLRRGGDAFFSNDSTKITFMDFELNAIIVMDLTQNTTKRININLPQNLIWHPKLSLDKTQVLFQADTSWSIIHKVNTNDNIVN